MIQLSNLIVSKGLKMEQNIKKWVWQHENYPNFPYDKSQLTELLNFLEYNRGLLDGVAKFFNSRDKVSIEVDILTQEALSTSAIEGEYLHRKSVQHSVEKRLDREFSDLEDSSTHQSDALVAVLLDCSLNREPLEVERLHAWHNALFEGKRYDVLNKIDIASFRTHSNMEVVSGAMGHEKVHYLALPQNQIFSDIERLLDWCNSSDESIYIKSALAHLWFVIIHPYDDGNGRIARAITDYLLSSQSSEQTFKLYSFSMAVNSDRKGYYTILDRTTNLFMNRDYDFTPWLIWHLKTLNSAMEMSLERIEEVISKTKFWDRCRDKSLNARQLKVLTKVFEKGNFEGGINTKKYMSIAKTSRATAVRDIKELLEYGCIQQIEGSSGRNVRYEVRI
jgi:Fic family protein